MSDKAQIPTGKDFAWRLAAFYAALFCALGVQLPFLPVWLAAKGLDAGEIGIVLALPMIVRIAAIPVATRLADRRYSLTRTLALTAAGTAAGYVLLGVAPGTAGILLALALASAFGTPLMPLTDAYALRGLAQRGRSYGPVRLWGSLAFIVGSFGAGLILDRIAPGHLIWLLVAATVLTAMAASALIPVDSSGASAAETGANGRAKKPSSAILLRSSAFLAVVSAASLIHASHAVYYGFSTLDWQALGLDGPAIGALWALGVVAEIALFALSARIPLSPVALLLLGAVGAVIRWGAMAFNPPLALLPLLQCLHGLSFGATHLGALGCMVRLAPPEIGATAQGYLAVAQGLMMAAAMGLAGVLYARYGALAYGAMAAAALVGAGVCTLALALGVGGLARTCCGRPGSGQV